MQMYPHYNFKLKNLTVYIIKKETEQNMLEGELKSDKMTYQLNLFFSQSEEINLQIQVKTVFFLLLRNNVNWQVR